MDYMDSITILFLQFKKIRYFMTVIKLILAREEKTFYLCNVEATMKTILISSLFF